MTPATVPNLTLDLRGLPNPEPILSLAVAAADWRAGDTICVLADDDRFASDFLRWCVGCDLDLVSLRYPSNGVTELTLHVPRGVQALRA
ncbi:MAG: Sulfurtransferase TusA [Chloroflexota bacterium]|jgi:TusA-related sulfurtransferase|nr:Sulfurtransferase TusA [Chloroflexota bacterium]